jgi:MerR family Zn(II)-responsive transcriptional regulator of zntA
MSGRHPLRPTDRKPACCRPLRIGDLARASGLTRDALRYYERKGLLPRSARTSGGFRQYEATALNRIRFIKQAQAHGLTLREIRELVRQEAGAGRIRCRRVRDLLARKLTELDARRRELDAFAATVREYLAMCNRALDGSSPVQCPVVESLTQAEAI